MITRSSTIADVYALPLGKDFLDLLFRTLHRDVKQLQSPLVKRMKLSHLDKLAPRHLAGLVDAAIDWLNCHHETAPSFPATVSKAWWKEAVCYQIYPRSFQDSNGDGIGDLAGVRQRLPYLKELGVNVIWLSPVYDSPDDDMGYDIRNYRKIGKQFGTMREFNALLSETHKLGMKLVMDLVLNHTSDEHKWYKTALQNPQSAERDYYIWAKGEHGKEPNNWNSIFSGSAWNYDEASDEWALHLFSKKQMDVNWQNPALREEMYEMIRYWLDKGVDGFRLDAINLISKGSLANGNKAMEQFTHVCGVEHYIYGPHLHEYLAEMNRECFAGRDVMTIGEAGFLGLETSRLVTAEERRELNMVFNFEHLDNAGKNRYEPYPFDLREVKAHFLRWQQEYGNNCWQSLFFENHDRHRMVSLINPDPAWSRVLGKLLAVMMFTLRGTPFIYQGQELGMTNVHFTGVSELRDVDALTHYETALARGVSKEAATELAAWCTRDHTRTPMQWNTSANGGFSEGTPWLKVNANYPTINVESQQDDPSSVLSFYKRMIALRKQNEALVYGTFSPVFMRSANTFCYFRIGGGKKFYVEINLTGDDEKRPGPLTNGHRLLAANYGGVARHLRPYEANVYIVENHP